MNAFRSGGRILASAIGLVARGVRTLIVRLPWWLTAVIVLVAVGAAGERFVFALGIGGALLVVALLVAAVRGRGPAEIQDWKQAEEAAAAWLRSVGCRGVEMTTAGADGGIDVLTQEWAVQVKHMAKRVGRPAVQQIVGAALDVGRQPAVISTSGFTAPAIAYANDHDVALVELHGVGHGEPITAPAREIGVRRRRRGVSRLFS